MPDGMPASMGDVKPSPSVKREDQSGAAPHRPPATNGLPATHNIGLRFATGGAGSADASPVSGLANGAHNSAASATAFELSLLGDKKGPLLVSGAGPQKSVAAGISTVMAAGNVTRAPPAMGVIPLKGETGGVPVKGPSQLSAAMMTATAENAGGGGAGLLAQMRATGTQFIVSLKCRPRISFKGDQAEDRILQSANEHV